MFLCDVHSGAIICFNNTPNYFIKVRALNGISGVVNLETGIFYDANDLRKQGIDLNHFSYVARNLNELFFDEEW